MFALHDAVHIDAGQVDVIGIDRTGRHDFLDLYHTDLAAHGGGRVKVAGCLAEHKVAGRIRLPGLHDRKVGKNTFFKDIGLAAKILVLLALGDDRANAGLGIKAGNACTARTHPLGQRALGIELELQFAREILAHELGVLAHIGRDHLLDLTGLQKNADTEIIDARVVRGEGQILRARIANGAEKKLGDTAQAKAARRDKHSVVQKPVEGLRRRTVDLVHGSLRRRFAARCCQEGAGSQSRPAPQSAVTAISSWLWARLSWLRAFSQRFSWARLSSCRPSSPWRSPARSPRPPSHRPALSPWAGSR